MKRIFLIQNTKGRYYSKKRVNKLFTFGGIEFATRFYIKEQADTAAELLTDTNLEGPFFIIEGFEKFKKDE
jgi:hypothetical protein